jgi:lysozyme
MKTSLKGLQELVGHEGIVLQPYLDSVGVPTVGIGHTSAAGLPYPGQMWGQKITLEQAMRLFIKDVERYEKTVNEVFPKGVPQHVFDAAVSFHYNTGAIKRASWPRHYKAGDMKQARRAFMAWRKPPEIIPRRQQEAALLFDGKYQHNGRAVVYPVSKKTNKPLWAQARSVDVSQLLRDVMWSEPAPAPEPPKPSSEPSSGIWEAIINFVFGLFTPRR